VVHPVHGRVDDYTPLVRGLGHDVTCYGLPHDYATENVTIETLARRLLARIRAAKPTGAVSLAGWCMGAPLVHEIARQANADGDGGRITHVILLDPPTTQPPPNPTDVLIGHLHGEIPHQTRTAITAAIATTKHLPIPEQAVALSGLLGPNGPTVPDHRLRSRIAMRLHFHAAMDGWQPTAKVPNLNVFLPHVATPGNESTSEMWPALATDITITTIPGDHTTMLDAPELAQAIAGLVTGTLIPRSPASVASTASPTT
jgi:thioesterase domain-containing protein